MIETGWFDRLKSALSVQSRMREVRLREPYGPGSSRVRVLFEGAPIGLRMARVGIELHIVPEIPLDASVAQSPPSFLLLDSNRQDSGIAGFLRLTEGETLILGRHDKWQSAIFDYPEAMGIRHLAITHDGDALIFKALLADCEIQLTPLPTMEAAHRTAARRREKLRKIRALYGGPIELLPPEEALATLRAVNALLETEPFRPLDDRGRPGGVLEPPWEPTPIIVGDLHAQVDNLLTLLTQNRFFDALEQGKATLIILGDAVHSEVEGRLEEMESSLLMMDLILKLKLRFPRQLFYIRGNHDSFYDTVFKFGVAQCLQWEAALRERRGEPYLREMERFYRRLPYVVLAEGYAACHAAPVKTRFSREMLVDIHRYPQLVLELTQNRLRQRLNPAGYSKGDVKHFRKTLGLPQETPFLVSHSPLTRDDGLWLNAGGIENHHIVFSANTPWIGVFTRVKDRMIPLRYRREELLPIVNGLS